MHEETINLHPASPDGAGTPAGAARSSAVFQRLRLWLADQADSIRTSVLTTFILGCTVAIAVLLVKVSAV